MLADLAVVSGDLQATPPEALTSLRVTQTWVGGQQAYGLTEASTRSSAS
jgi:predicted amidohydrolase YtcJ